MVQEGLSQWIEGARSGDHAALAELIRRHHNVLHAWLAPKIDKDWQGLLSPEDVLQQTYTDMFLNIGRFVPSGPNSFLLWAKRIAENNYRDALRGLQAGKRGKGSRRLFASEEQNSQEFLERLVGHVSTRMGPSRVAARQEHEQILRAAIEKLPSDYAAIVTRYDLLGQSMQEIAADLGRSVGAAHMIRARAHRRLRDLLTQQSEFFQPTA